MKKLLLGTFAIVLGLGLSQVIAQGADLGPSTRVLTARLTINLGGTAVSGACSDEGYASTCYSGNCECLNDNSATIAGSIAGKGSAVVFITDDIGQMVPATASVSGSNICSPLYVDAVVTSTLKNQPLTETISMHLVVCHRLTNNGKSTVGGGFGIETGASNNASGWGTVSGTVDTSTDIATLTLKGLITQ